MRVVVRVGSGKNLVHFSECADEDWGLDQRWVENQVVAKELDLRLCERLESRVVFFLELG